MSEPPRLPRIPRRVISLVPSTTETLFDLGLGEFLVGRTDYCTRPKDKVASVPSVGGTKDPDLARIRQLRPDLVLANQEENSEQVVRELAAEGLAVWTAFPKTVQEAIADLRTLASLFGSARAAGQVDLLERAMEWTAASAPAVPAAVFVPIWRSGPAENPGWYMTFNRDTYAHDLLRLCGGRNVFANRERRYPLEADLGGIPAREEPGGRDLRYPRVDLEEIRQAQPEILLLPDEPFAFGDDDLRALVGLLPDVPAMRSGRLRKVEGSLLFWHGTRMGLALRAIPPLLV